MNYITTRINRKQKAKIATRNQRNLYNFNIPEVLFIITNNDTTRIKLNKN